MRPATAPDPHGRLAATMLRALAAGLSDPGRFGRAKAYARDGAVVDVHVDPGAVTGEIQGSRYEPYRAAVHVAPLEDAPRERDPATSAALLVPDHDELATTCSCPDGDRTGVVCKHALATLLVFADEVAAEPALLARWRSGPAVDGERRAPPPDVTTARRRVTPVDVLATRLVAPARRPGLPDLEPLERRVLLTDAVSEALVSALDVLADRG